MGEVWLILGAGQMGLCNLLPPSRQIKRGPMGPFLFVGGEGGIRTHDTLPYTHFPGVLLRPLGHLTVFSNSFFSVSKLPVRLTARVHLAFSQQSLFNAARTISQHYAEFKPSLPDQPRISDVYGDRS